VTEVEVYVHPGDIVGPLTSGADRIGHVIALADTRVRAETAAERALAELRIETRAER
jgi:hypothetical protein